MGDLYAVVKRLVESGVTVLGLAALDAQAVPGYDRDDRRGARPAGRARGGHDPDELAEWVAAKVL